ncbi:MAG TPA: YHYH protein [Candidatus Dojkabacteria bacterium]|jgi:hypothetical protein
MDNSAILQPNALTQQTESQDQAKSNKSILVVLFIVIIITASVGAGFFIINMNSDNNSSDNNTSEEINNNQDQNVSEESKSELDLTALPLGDDKYSTSPKIGYVYSCQTSFGGSGAFEQGPWIDADAGTWDLTKKISVDGNVSWPQAYWEESSSGEMRIIKSADLPDGHTTGEFPVATDDDAYNYDRNPNSIEEQTISFEVPKNPTLLSSPDCVGGEVGIATTGVLIFNAFDAGGRDAVATEIQDECEGHPQEGDYYHYHGYSSCFEDNEIKNEHSDLLGYALDGFGIYGLKGENGVELSTADLDECHGHTHTIEWDGEEKEMFHYHMTQDFPYTVGCFRGQVTTKSLSSGGQGRP